MVAVLAPLQAVQITEQGTATLARKVVDYLSIGGSGVSREQCGAVCLRANGLEPREEHLLAGLVIGPLREALQVNLTAFDLQLCVRGGALAAAAKGKREHHGKNQSVHDGKSLTLETRMATPISSPLSFQKKEKKYPTPVCRGRGVFASLFPGVALPRQVFWRRLTEDRAPLESDPSAGNPRMADTITARHTLFLGRRADLLLMGNASLVTAENSSFNWTMPITDRSTEYIHPVLGCLTDRSFTPGSVNLKLPGGETHLISGTWKKYPNGTRWIRFEPQIGTANQTTAEPPSPITTAPSQTPMPANRGLKLRGLSGAASVGVVIMVAEMISAHGEYQTMMEAQRVQDLEMIGVILTEPEPELEGFGRRISTRDKTERDSGQRRIRIHGYSRKGA